MEIILTCGFYMTMARLTETTRVDVDAPPGVAVPASADVKVDLGAEHEPLRQGEIEDQAHSTPPASAR